MRTWRVAVLAAVALVLAGCAAPAAGRAGSPDTLVIALSDQPDNLNPIFGDIYGSIYGDHWPIFSSLLDYDQRVDLTPDLAAALPELSPDGRTVTVRLRDGVRWHDGQPFTATDVEFTYRAFLNPAVATALRDQLYNSLASVVAVDPHTVRFSLSRVDPAFADKLTLGIVPAHILAGQDLNTTPFNLAPVGTGPFVFDELRPGERLALRANPDYYGGRVEIPRVVFSFVPDENVRATRLRSGELDVDAVGLPPRLADGLRGVHGARVVRIPGETTVLLLPENNPLFADPAVRRAVGMVVDRQAIAAGVFAGAARPTVTPIAAGHWAHAELPVPPPDPAGAGRLLDQAGWTPGPDGIRQRAGQPLAFPLVYGAGSSVSNNTALALRDQLARIGMRANLEGLSFEAQTERLAQGTSMLDANGNAYDPELDFYRAFHSSFADDGEAFTDGTRMRSPAVDAALDTGRSTSDRAVRGAAYAELQRALVGDGSYLYLVQGEDAFVVSDRVLGITPQPREGHVHGFSRGLLWNLQKWRLAAP